MPAVFELRKNRGGTADAKQLLESEKLEAMGRVVGGVAHDFNNLLTGILLYCDLLIAGLGSDHPMLAYAQEIRRAGGHSSRLIEQLLMVARPPLEDSCRLSWNEVIADARNFLSRLLGENVELVTNLAVRLAAHATRSRPHAANSVQPAAECPRRHAPGRPHHPDHAAARRRGKRRAAGRDRARHWVELTVADTGCGMDRETRSHLFEHFFTTKAPGRGSGLGLATVSRIVQEENGTIAVETEPGAGTRVMVCLPAANRNPTRREENSQSGPGKTDLISRRGNQP